jgi:hypothetical protein
MFPVKLNVDLTNRPMLFFATALFACFLLLLAGLAFAGLKASSRNKDGKQGGGCVPGCLLGCGLFGLGLVGLAGFLVMLVAIGTDRSIARVALLRRSGSQPWPAERMAVYPLNLRFDVRGDLAAWVESDLRSVLAKLCDCEPEITTQRVFDDEGREVLRLDVALPAERDVRQFLEWVEEALPSLNGVEGVEVVFRGLGL